MMWRKFSPCFAASTECSVKAVVKIQQGDLGPSRRGNSVPVTSCRRFWSNSESTWKLFLKLDPEPLLAQLPPLHLHFESPEAYRPHSFSEMRHGLVTRILLHSAPRKAAGVHGGHSLRLAMGHPLNWLAVALTYRTSSGQRENSLTLRWPQSAVALVRSGLRRISSERQCWLVPLWFQ